MTTAALKLHKTGTLTLSARLIRAVRGCWTKRQRDMDKAVKHLNAMNNHCLKDIGIHRSQINLVYKVSVEKVQYQNL